ncbi:hypothetical protein ANN_20830 [Periplaneta americana]|uniref:Uncharacterized protein n=1 Tax=Periplaneta americana TaxID=6978 RepID=A0ABQ8SED0_PERAM|nr:hypothetical protein ANN_20830 [Periplaneta americana]
MTTDTLCVRVACWVWMSYDGAGLLERIHVKRILRSNWAEQPPVRTPEELWDRVLNAWEKMVKNLDLFHNLVDSMPRRMSADVDAGAGLVPVAWQQWSEMEALIPSPAACEISSRKALVFLNRRMRLAKYEARIAQIRTTREIVSGFYGCEVHRPRISQL